MPTKEGFRDFKPEHWKYLVPNEYCKPGLEICITANFYGLAIGSILIPWNEIEAAKRVVEEINEN